MGTTAAERKAAERINRQVASWRYRAELEHTVGVAAGRVLAHGDAISRAELIERTVTLLVQSSNDAARKLLRRTRSALKTCRRSKPCATKRLTACTLFREESEWEEVSESPSAGAYVGLLFRCYSTPSSTTIGSG